MPIVQCITQQISRHIKTEHRHDILPTIMDGNNISNQVHVHQVFMIDIRPHRGVCRYDGFIISILGIVMTLGNHLCIPDLPMVPPGEGFEQSSLFRVILRHEGHPAARQVRMRLEHPLHHTIGRVRMDDIPFQVPDMTTQRVLRHAQEILDDDSLDAQLRLGPSLQLVSQQTTRIIILYRRDALQQNSRNDDDGQAGVGLQMFSQPPPPIFYSRSLLWHIFVLVM